MYGRFETLSDRAGAKTKDFEQRRLVFNFTFCENFNIIQGKVLGNENSEVRRLRRAGEIYTLSFMWDKLNYIHFNPIRAGIVEKAQHYLYSSASNYVEGKGLVNVELVEHPIVNTNKPNELWKYGNYDE